MTILLVNNFCQCVVLCKVNHFS